MKNRSESGAGSWGSSNGPCVNMINLDLTSSSRFALALALVALTFIPAVTKAEKGEVRSGSDPTDFITRYEPSYEFTRFDNGSETQALVVRFDFALRRDLSVRVDLPWVDFDPSSTQRQRGFHSDSGFGDAVTQIIHKPIARENYAFVYGLRIDWDTAAEDELGRGGNVYAPLTAIAWYPKPGLIIAPLFQWFIGDDLDNDPLPGDRDIDELSYRQIVLWQPNKKYMTWLKVDPEVIIDFENDDETTYEVKVEWGKLVKKTVGVFVESTIGLGGERKDWAIKAGFRHMFPQKTFFK